MTPPTLKQIDVSALEDLNLLLYAQQFPSEELKIDPQLQKKVQKLQKALEGSDLEFKPENTTFEVYYPKDCSKVGVDCSAGTPAYDKIQISVMEEANLAAMIQHADSPGLEETSDGNFRFKKGDGTLTIEEAEKFLTQHPNVPIGPLSFLQKAEDYMARRYRPIAKNLAKWRGRHRFEPTLYVLNLYSQGLEEAGKNHAKSYLPFHGLPKSAGNATLLPGVTAANGAKWLYNLTLAEWMGLPEAEYLPWMIRDAACLAEEDELRARREVALFHLKFFIEQGVVTDADWIQKGDIGAVLRAMEGEGLRLQAAAKGLGEQYIEAVRVLRHELPTEATFNILNHDKPEEMWEAMFEFMAAERAQDFMGFSNVAGGGNTEPASSCNYGSINNLQFVRAMTNYMMSGALHEDQEIEEALQLRAELLHDETLGNGGGWANLWAVGLWNMVPGTESQEALHWSDEDALAGPGRALGFGIAVFSARPFWWFYNDVKLLEKSLNLHGLLHLGNAYLRGARILPFTRTTTMAMRQAHLEKLTQAAAEYAKVGNVARSKTLEKAAALVKAEIDDLEKAAGDRLIAVQMKKTADQLPTEKFAAEAKEMREKAGNMLDSAQRLTASVDGAGRIKRAMELTKDGGNALEVAQASEISLATAIRAEGWTGAWKFDFPLKFVPTGVKSWFPLKRWRLTGPLAGVGSAETRAWIEAFNRDKVFGIQALGGFPYNVTGWIGGGFGKIFGLPGLKQISKAEKSLMKGLESAHAMDALALVGLTYYAEAAFLPKIQKQKFNHDLEELRPWEDPTKPDPQLLEAFQETQVSKALEKQGLNQE